MRTGPAIRTFVVSVLIATVVSCTGVQQDGTTEEASGLTAQQLSDVPIPDGLTLQTGLNESHSFESGRLRHADLYYYGNLSVEEIGEYLKNRMPDHGWQLVDEVEGERTELVFERRPNRARCTVWVDDTSVTRLHVEVRTPTTE